MTGKIILTYIVPFDSLRKNGFMNEFPPKFIPLMFLQWDPINVKCTYLVYVYFVNNLQTDDLEVHKTTMLWFRIHKAFYKKNVLYLEFSILICYIYI